MTHLMDWDDETDVALPRLGTCQGGFSASALAMGALCIADLALLGYWLDVAPHLGTFLDSSLWFYAIDLPSTWLSLIGAYALWASNPNPRWRRVAGWLVLLNAIDTGLWIFARADRLNLPWAGLIARYNWFVLVVTLGLSLLEMIALGILGTNAARQADGRFEDGFDIQSPGPAASARIGLFIWMFLAVLMTDWTMWPARPMPRQHPFEVVLLILLCRIIASFRLTVDCLLAARRIRAASACREALRDGHESLRSRSETELDDEFWR